MYELVQLEKGSLPNFQENSNFRHSGLVFGSKNEFRANGAKWIHFSECLYNSNYIEILRTFKNYNGTRNFQETLSGKN